MSSWGEQAGSTFTVKLPLYSTDMISTVGLRSYGSSSSLLPSPDPINSSQFEVMITSSHLTEEGRPASSPASARGLEKSEYVSVRPYSETEPQPADLEVGFKRVRQLEVLVVDDSLMNRRMVCKILENSNEFRCEQAEDGRCAVEMVHKKMFARYSDVSKRLEMQRENVPNMYDIILMDYQMPEMDGPTAITEIRKLGFCGIILGLTGNALQCDRDAMVAAGADGVLVKPLNMELFWSIIRRLLP